MVSFKYKVGDEVIELKTGNTYVIYGIDEHYDSTYNIYYARKKNNNKQSKEFYLHEIMDASKKDKPYSNIHYKNMSNEAKAFISIMNSLNVSVNQAGGMGFSLEELENMTGAELLAILAPNNVRFKYTGK